MAKLGINTGILPNDGAGDSLLEGAVKINNNFNEIYNAIGNGTTITNSIGYASTSGISTTSQGLTGSPNIIVGNISASTLNVTGVVTATDGFTSGITTAPVKISVSTGRIVFTVAGIGSTSFQLV